ncbi:MAG: hypothetical protein J2P26_03675 [Nocardiopsaceae bacterium]|nr:hypothetical protein [Nocardiopsaceae bacterium]
MRPSSPPWPPPAPRCACRWEDDGVEAITGRLDSVRAEIATWEKVARDTRFR